MKKIALAVVMLSIVAPSWAQWSEKSETALEVVALGDLAATKKKSKKSSNASQTPRAKLYKKYNKKHVDMLYNGKVVNGMDAGLVMDFFELNPNLGECLPSSYGGLYNMGVTFYGGKSYSMFFDKTVYDVEEN